MTGNQTMNRIDAYSFGSMVISGIRYTKDVIIFPDGTILCPWWRNRGHVLETADIQDLIDIGPDIIICGTGAMGVMRVSEQLQENLQERGIEFIVRKSSQAVDTFNKMAGTGKVGACFHLTC